MPALTAASGRASVTLTSQGQARQDAGKSAQLWELTVEVVANPYADRFMHLEIRQIRHREEFNSG
jgi:hypothetical protein